MQITVIIPTYNEAENLPKLAEEILSLPLDIRMLVVDDHSPDGTGHVADALAVRYNGRISVLHRAGKLGLRTAYIEGFQMALDQGADAIGQMDADFSHDPKKLVEMAAAMEAGADVVIGSRYVAGGSLDESWPLWRKLLSGFGNFYARTILGIHDIHDMTSGFRLWRRQTLLAMPLERISASGYIFLVEMAYLAHCLGFAFRQVPIHFKERVKGKSKMSLGIQLEAAVKVWQVKANYADLKASGVAGRKQA